MGSDDKKAALEKLRNNLKTKDFEDLKTDYLIQIENIRISKKQMWSTLYLTVVAIAAVVALYGTMNNLTYLWAACIIKTVFIYLMITIAFGGILFLLIQNEHQQGYRDRVEIINQLIFNQEVRERIEYISVINTHFVKKYIRSSLFIRNKLFLYIFIGVISIALFVGVIGLIFA